MLVVPEVARDSDMRLNIALGPGHLDIRLANILLPWVRPRSVRSSYKGIFITRSTKAIQYTNTIRLV